MKKSLFSNPAYTADYFLTITLDEMIEILESEYANQIDDKSKEIYLDFLSNELYHDFTSIEKIRTEEERQKRRKIADCVRLWVKLKRKLPSEQITAYMIDTSSRHYLEIQSFLFNEFGRKPIHERTNVFNNFLSQYSEEEQNILMQILRMRIVLNSNNNPNLVHLDECVKKFNTRKNQSTIARDNIILIKQGTMPKKVFISYNHNDKEAARHLKNALEKEGIAVTIDSEAMIVGSKISDFIRQSIANTEVTVSIISEKSLLSAWVAMESILTLHNQKQFIACYITNKFFDNDFIDVCEDEIDKRINELNTELKERLDKGRGIEHLTDELTRQRDLKHNLSKFIGELRSRLCIDISGYNFLDNMPKVIKAIKE